MYQKEYYKKWAKNNREKVLAYKRKWWKKHYAEIKALKLKDKKKKKLSTDKS